MDNQSILNDIKRSQGLPIEVNNFDNDLKIHINSIFSILNSKGIGPESPYRITNSENCWSEFIEDNKSIDMVKSYMDIRVTLLFDPPASSVLYNAMTEQYKEIEWILKELCDTLTSDIVEEVNNEQ